jgi:hypothetical protein
MLYDIDKMLYDIDKMLYDIYKMLHDIDEMLLFVDMISQQLQLLSLAVTFSIPLAPSLNIIP